MRTRVVPEGMEPAVGETDLTLRCWETYLQWRDYVINQVFAHYIGLQPSTQWTMEYEAIRRMLDLLQNLTQMGVNGEAAAASCFCLPDRLSIPPILRALVRQADHFRFDISPAKRCQL